MISSHVHSTRLCHLSSTVAYDTKNHADKSNTLVRRNSGPLLSYQAVFQRFSQGQVGLLDSASRALLPNEPVSGAKRGG